MISRPRPPRRAGGDLADDRAHHRGGGRQLERRDEVGHRGREAQLHQRRAVRRRIRAHQLQRQPIRRHEPAQRVDGHREEGEVGRDDRHRHPRLPVAERKLVAPRHDHRRQRDEGHGLRHDDPRQQPALEPVRPEHEDRQGEADDDAGEEADERLAEGEQGRVDEVLPERRGVAGALRLTEPAQDVEEGGQRRVVGGDGQRSRGTRPDVAGGRPHGLVAGPDQPDCGHRGGHERDPPERASNGGSARPRSRRHRRRGHVLALTRSATAGTTCCP